MHIDRSISKFSVLPSLLQPQQTNVQTPRRPKTAREAEWPRFAQGRTSWAAGRLSDVYMVTPKELTAKENTGRSLHYSAVGQKAAVEPQSYIIRQYNSK